jgi:uncharacterized phage protein (TIGR01671 family)
MNTREIRFRAWDKEKHRMLDWTAINTWTFGNLLADSKNGLKPLMQYTGLKDVEGKEIYEGDIVKWGDHCVECHENPVRIAEVRFAPDIQFDVRNVDYIFKFGRFAYQDTDKHLEIIGNVYEHPHLFAPKK